jgi:hypothetical protein
MESCFQLCEKFSGKKFARSLFQQGSRARAGVASFVRCSKFWGDQEAAESLGRPFP